MKEWILILKGVLLLALASSFFGSMILGTSIKFGGLNWEPDNLGAIRLILKAIFFLIIIINYDKILEFFGVSEEFRKLKSKRRSE